MADMDYLCTYLNLSDADIAALYERADLKNCRGILRSLPPVLWSMG